MLTSEYIGRYEVGQRGGEARRPGGRSAIRLGPLRDTRFCREHPKALPYKSSQGTH